MATSNLRRAALATTLLLLATAACTSVPPATPETPPAYLEDPAAAIPSGSDAEYTSDGLVRVPSDRLRGARLYVRPPRPRLQRFDEMILTPPVIEYKHGVSGWNGRKEENLRNRFRRELVETIPAEDFWAETSEVSPSSVIIRTTIAEFDPQASTGDASGSSTSFVSAGGGALLGFELFDPTDRKPLMRYVERYTLPGGVYSGANVDEQRMDLVIDRFARRIGTMLRLQYSVVRAIGEHEQGPGPE